MKQEEPDFYRKMNPAPSLMQAFSEKSTHALPEDWFVIITDIAGSTAAIEEGNYRDVNKAGGLAAMALSNAFDTLEFPFIFGGDGATFLIPPRMRVHAEDILVDTANKVKEFFNLNLRVGVVPAKFVYDAGYSIQVGKIQISPYYLQAVIMGDGIEYAEKLVKNKEEYRVTKKQNPMVEANFSGFSCRWHDVPSENGETVALIVRLNGENEIKKELLLQQVFQIIEKYYGTEAEYHPIQESAMQLAFTKKIIWREAAARAGKKNGILYFFILIRIFLENLLARLAIWLSLPIKSFHYQVDRIKWYNVISSDFKKFDGMLKMVLSGTPEARTGLTEALEKWRRDGNLYYGLHTSNRALLTCLLHAGSEQEVHFVDAADGGYAMAAKMLKKQMSA